jgi:sec-independent protein translocase protein TatA
VKSSRLRYPPPMGLENPLHILLLLVVILLVFGAKRLPEIGRSLGEGMRGFKDSISGDSNQSLTSAPPAAAPVANAMSVAPAAPAPPSAPVAPPTAPPVPAGVATHEDASAS